LEGQRPLRQNKKFFNPFKLICPVQPCAKKESASRETQISPRTRAIPAREEGRIAIVTNVGPGCGGRDSAGRAIDIAGRVFP
jgi:hypothetical protein